MQNLEKRIEALEEKSNVAESMLIVRVIVTPFNLGKEWRTVGVPGIDRRWERDESEAAEAFKQRVFDDAQAEGVKILVVNGDIDPDHSKRPDGERPVSRPSTPEVQE